MLLGLFFSSSFFHFLFFFLMREAAGLGFYFLMMEAAERDALFIFGCFSLSVFGREAAYVSLGW